MQNQQKQQLQLGGCFLSSGGGSYNMQQGGCFLSSGGGSYNMQQGGCFLSSGDGSYNREVVEAATAPRLRGGGGCLSC
ncbi:hypothetical protein AMTR_s00026p00148090 [Amborella trichopoda]|uniref:Uncharacterized protein n=1 Tax=Amborella trichopoda TaxID=13333 RepID=W1PK79_AMBTC|nr:hypothetical protein AMTR_s00026p00148090 [Amborella trichopoda]